MSLIGTGHPGTMWGLRMIQFIFPSGICRDVNQCHGHRRNPTEAESSFSCSTTIKFIDLEVRERVRRMSKTAAKANSEKKQEPGES